MPRKQGSLCSFTGEATSRRPALLTPQDILNVRGIPAGDYRVTTALPGKDRGGVIANPPIHVDEGETLENLALIWSEGALIEGRVLNGETGDPVADAAITLQPEGHETTDLESEARSTESGSYRFRVLPGVYTVFVDKRNYVPISGQTVTLRAGPQTQDYTLQPYPRTKVTIVDEAGKPQANAAIERDWVVESTTDEKGQALVSLPPLPLVFHDTVLIVNDLGHLVAVWERREEDSREMTITLRKAATLTGLVKKADGTPLAGADVYVMMWAKLDVPFPIDNSRFQPGGVPIQTDAEGRYRCTGLVPGFAYQVLAKARGFPFSGCVNVPNLEVGAVIEMEPIITGPLQVSP